MRKKIVSLLLVIAAMVAVVVVGKMKVPMKEVIKEEDTESPLETVYDKETVYFWYSDDTLTNYISSAAVEYNEANGTRIMPVLQSPVDYLETINQTAIESDVPDIYLITHDTLGKACLAGLADVISLPEGDFDDYYIGQAKNSVNYKDKLMAYPLSFEACAMVYNETYLKDMAVRALDDESVEKDENGNPINPVDEDEETALEEGESKYSDEEIAAKIQDMIPLTIEELRNLGDSFDAPEQVESFLTWDVTDIFYNYFFLGDAIDVGGDAGWNSAEIDIYNVDSIRALEAYQELNQFFAIDTSESEYAQVVQDFLDGKLVFTIATSDIIARIERAKYEGDFEYDYGVALIPDMDDRIETRTMSITNCVAINPFSKNIKVANDFAKFLTYDYADKLYSKSEKVSVASNVNYEFGGLGIYAMEYGYSMPLPKMIQTSNLWVQLEAMFADVWDGQEPNEALKELAEQITYQVTGEKTELAKIDIPKEEEEIEYLDEDELMAEAQAAMAEENEE